MSIKKKLFLLDTSAILSFLEDESGANRVETILKKHNAVIPFVVYLEVFYITCRENGEEVAEKRYVMLKKLDVEYIDCLPEPVLLKAGQFKSRFKLSLADSIIAAFACVRKAILVHKDPDFELLNGIVEEEKLPYKKTLS